MLIVLAAVAAWPLARTIWFGFTDASLDRLSDAQFVGFRNYLSWFDYGNGRGEWEGVLPLWYDRASLNYRDSPQSGVRRMTFEQVDNKTKSTGEMVEMVDF
jgi:ABC-type sugar transport system permease subunit